MEDVGFQGPRDNFVKICGKKGEGKGGEEFSMGRESRRHVEST